MGLNNFQRFRMATLPTPLHKLERLSAALNGPDIYIKRDDLTGLAFGGNKTRKLEYLVANAIEYGATHLITEGGIQSNHVRQTAAAANLAGMKSHLVLQSDDPTPPLQGNYLLDDILGATCHVVSPETSSGEKMQEVAELVRSEGGEPYLIPSGGSTPIGALGYASAILEINTHLWDLGIAVDHLYFTSGSGGTQAGIVVGNMLYGSSYDARGFSSSPTTPGARFEKIQHLAAATCDLVDAPFSIDGDDIILNFSQAGEGYGVPTAECLEAIQLLARTEGILLDPVYTGKAFAGMIADITSGILTPQESVLFLHTGGTPALFAKVDELQPILHR